MPVMNDALRRGRRQAGRRRSPSTSTSASPSTSRSPTARARCSCPSSRTPTRSTSRGSGRRTRTSSARSAPTSSTADDFAGTTISLTNPGTIGTVQSVPRLMPGQGAIVGVGAIDYPAEYQGADAARRSPSSACRKVITLTSTYDHRIIQGAESGDVPAAGPRAAARRGRLLRRRLPRARRPVRAGPLGRATSPPSHEDDVDKQTRVAGADPRLPRARPPHRRPRPAGVGSAATPSSTSSRYGLTLWDLDREFLTGGLGGKPIACSSARSSASCATSYCRTHRHRVHAHPGPRASSTGSRSRSRAAPRAADREEQRHILGGSTRPRRSRSSCRPSTSARSASARGRRVGHPAPRRGPVGGRRRRPRRGRASAWPHRGRLNVLANIVGKCYDQIFREFEGNLDPRLGAGLGRREVPPRHRGQVHRARRRARSRSTLAANPSHLEAVDPVVEGMARAKQDLHRPPRLASRCCRS